VLGGGQEHRARGMQVSAEKANIKAACKRGGLKSVSGDQGNKGATGEPKGNQFHSSDKGEEDSSKNIIQKERMENGRVLH